MMWHPLGGAAERMPVSNRFGVLSFLVADAFELLNKLRIYLRIDRPMSGLATCRIDAEVVVTAPILHRPERTQVGQPFPEDASPEDR